MTKHEAFETQKDWRHIATTKQSERNLRVAILITEGFSLLSLTSLTDVFSAVHSVSPSSKVNVSLMTVDGKAVRSQSGVKVTPDLALSTELRGGGFTKEFDFVIICSGLKLSEDESNCTLNLVRNSRRNGISICVIGAAVWSVAMSGCIRKGTDHWSRIPGIREAMPHLEFENAIFVRDGGIYSCAGELGAMDFALSWVGEHVGSETASQICNHLLVQFSRNANQIQTCTAADRFKGVPGKLLQAIDLMISNIEEPISISGISNSLNISIRQLERMFAQHLSTSPVKFYRRQQLDTSMKLINQTNMPLIEVALASGFSTPSTLCRGFKKEFGFTPTEARNMFRLN
jgi:transcriptional regulator GlxA family with amidase domain